VRSVLLKYGGANVVVMNIPWRLEPRSAVEILETELKAELLHDEEALRSMAARLGASAAR
jgi:hypothetical protein